MAQEAATKDDKQNPRDIIFKILQAEDPTTIDIEALKKALGQVTELDLSMCEIGNKAASKLAEALTSCGKPIAIDLSSNDLTEEGANALVKAANSNENISIDLSDNNITDPRTIESMDTHTKIKFANNVDISSVSIIFEENGSIRPPTATSEGASGDEGYQPGSDTLASHTRTLGDVAEEA